MLLALIYISIIKSISNANPLSPTAYLSITIKVLKQGFEFTKPKRVSSRIFNKLGVRQSSHSSVLRLVDRLVNNFIVKILSSHKRANESQLRRSHEKRYQQFEIQRSSRVPQISSIQRLPLASVSSSICRCIRDSYDLSPLNMTAHIPHKMRTLPQ